MDQRAEVYYTALFVNVGCHIDAHEQAKWFSDDIALKAIKYDHEPRSIRMALHRFRLGLEFAISGHRETDSMIAHHAAIARAMGEHLGFGPSVLDALGAAYERWDSKAWRGDLGGGDVPLGSRIAQIAEYAEVANRVGGVDAVRTLARERRGAQFDPTLCDVLDNEGDVILSGLDGLGTWDAVIDAEPTLAVVLSGERLDAALAAVAELIDLKSPYFLGHARAVAELAAQAADDCDRHSSTGPDSFTTSAALASRTRSGTSPARSAPANGSGSGSWLTGMWPGGR